MRVLGQRLRQLRLEQGSTVRELAEHIGKTAGYISRIEIRGEIPSPELLCTFAEIFSIDPEELLALAKQGQLERTERDIEARQASALSMYRKEKQ